MMLTCFIAACLIGQASKAQDWLLIENVSVLDGTGSPSRLASVAVIDGRISHISPADNLRSAFVTARYRRIDGSGLVLSPGFIDSHSHADLSPEKDLTLESQVRQGITTVVVGQDGMWSEPYANAMSRVLSRKPSINFASFSGHGGIRGKVMGDDWQRWSTSEEREQMKLHVEEDMKAGALGLSTGLVHAPASASDTQEVIELAKVAAKFKGIYISHVRNEDATALQSFEELIRIAKEAKIPAQISHIKLGLPSVWGQSKQAIQMFEDARRSGLDITADIYPYTFWQNSPALLVAQQDWGRLGAWQQALRELGGADKIQLSVCSYKREWEGNSLQQIADAASTDPAEIIQEIVLNTYGPGNNGQVRANFTSMCEPDIVNFLKWPHTSISTDGIMGSTHPRVAGTFPRILGRYVREANVLSLPEAVRRMTSLPAKRFGFKDRGIIKEGVIADLVLFDPKTVADASTTKNPHAFAKGIKYVIVHGRIVVDMGRLTNERPGQIITRTGAPFKRIPLPKLSAVNSVEHLCCEG